MPLFLHWPLRRSHHPGFQTRPSLALGPLRPGPATAGLVQLAAGPTALLSLGTCRSAARPVPKSAGYVLRAWLLLRTRRRCGWLRRRRRGGWPGSSRRRLGWSGCSPAPCRIGLPARDLDFVQLTLGSSGDGSARWWLDGDEVRAQGFGAGGDEVRHGVGLRSGEAAGAGY